MKIGMVSLCYHPITNGVVQMIDLYRTQFEKLGHQVVVFTFGTTAESEDTAVITSPAFPLGNSGYYAHWRMSQAAQRQMAQMDILHAHHLFVTMRMARRYGNCPVVYTNHTRYDLYTKHLFPPLRPFVDRAMRRAWPQACAFADAVIAPSRSAQRVLRQFNVNQNVRVIENGIDLVPFQHAAAPRLKADFGLPETAVLLIYVGRLSKEKNVVGLIEQYGKTAVRCPDAHLLLIGDGPARPTIAQFVQQNRLAERVQIIGELPHNQLPNYLAAADLFVTASVSEIHPVTLIEAMAAGLPIVAPHAPGNEDIVLHEQTGLLTSSKENGLADAMMSLISDPALRAKMGALAKQKSERYNVEAMATKTVTLYEQLLAGR